MKIRWNHRYVQLGVTAFLVIAASILSVSYTHLTLPTT